MESLLVEAHEGGDRAFDYNAWRNAGAPEATLRAELAASIEAARQRRPEEIPQLDHLAGLYASGEDVEPLIAEAGESILASGGRH